MGVSGRKMIEGPIAGQTDVVALAEMAQRRRRDKIPQLQRALEGDLTEHHRFSLRELLEQYDYFEKKIASISERDDGQVPAFLRRGQKIDPLRESQSAGPGASGGNRDRHESLPTHKHFTSWAGQCPGSYESAGQTL